MEQDYTKAQKVFIVMLLFVIIIVAKAVTRYGLAGF